MEFLVVRESTPEDDTEIAEVDGLAVADLRKVYRPTAAAVARRADLVPHLRRLVAAINGRIVGVVQYCIDGDDLSFLGLGVHPAFRRRGVATALVRRLEELGREHGCAAVSLRTIKETGNVALFERMGFEVVSEGATGLFEGVHVQPVSEVVMRRELT